MCCVWAGCEEVDVIREVVLGGSNVLGLVMVVLALAALVLLVNRNV